MGFSNSLLDGTLYSIDSGSVFKLWCYMDDESQHMLPLERILDLATDAIITVDDAQRIVMFNQGAVRIFGYLAHEALGQALDMLIPHEVVETHRRHMRDFAAAAEAARPRAMGQQRQVFGRRKDGSEFPAEASIIKHVDHGRTTYTVILRDTSAQKQIEDVLRQAEARHRLLIDSIQDYAIYMLDPVGRIVSWNSGAERLKGYQAEEIIGHNFARFFAPEDRGLGKPEVELQIAATAGRYAEEGWRVRKDGSHFWASVVITAVRDEHGQLLGFAKVTRDVTERRQAEDTLRWYANQLNVLYEISRAILLAQSPQAIAEATLQRLRRLVPCRYAQVLSLPVVDATEFVLIADADDPYKIVLSDLAADVLQRSLAAQTQEHALATFDLESGNSPAPAFQPFRAVGLRMLVIAPLVAQNALIGQLLLANDSPAGFDTSQLEIVRQVADQLAVALQHARLFEEVKVSREQLQRLSHRLIEVQEAERRTIAGELHDEIGQALTIVKMNLQAVQRLSGNTETESYLSETVASVEHALDQVRNLSLDLRPSLLDDLGLVAALRWYVARQTRLAGFVLHFSADELGGRLTPALETACFRVAQEALTNVVRHAQAHEVWVALHCQSELCLTIRDDGVGFNVAAAQARAAHGGSLGLLGMRERVGIVGGRLTISSSPGQGTHIQACFSLQRPPIVYDDERDAPR
jgi:PAS domain S-box-containing protein